MAETFTRKKSNLLARILSSQWFAPVLYLLVVRILLNVIVLAVANMLPATVWKHFTEPISFSPLSLPGVWVRYDSGYYLNIAMRGYSYQGADVNFLPVYPVLIRLFSLGSTNQTVVSWSAFLLSNVSFLLAGLLLWDQVRKDLNELTAWNTLVTLSVFPTAFFFSAVYTESLFLLFAILVYWAACQRHYRVAAVFVALASLTRINGAVLVVIPLVEIFFRERRQQPWRKAAQVVSVSALGMASFMVYTWVTQGAPLAFLQVQTSFMGRSVAFPWKTLGDSLLVSLTGAGGNQVNWFMRLVTLHDLAMMMLFLALAVLSFRWLPKSQAVYLLAAWLFLSISHGPGYFGVFSGSRYVLALFPGFVVLGILAEKIEPYKVAAWTLSVLLMLLLAGWWVSGHWVA